MNLNYLEQLFFDEILNAELDLPVNATLEYEGDIFDIITVPEIAPKGYFRLKYYNATKRNTDTHSKRRSEVPLNLEIFGLDPSLERAWLNGDTLTMQLHQSPLSINPKSSQQLDVKLLYADTGHRGELRLNENQVIRQNTKLKKAALCTLDFPDFRSPRKQWRHVAKIGASERQKLQSVSNKLGDDGTIKIQPPQHQAVLESNDGWKILFTKDTELTRGLINHTGLIERTDNSEYKTDELDNLLEALKYFFAFATGAYRHPTVVVGYDYSDRPVWGKIGSFEPDPLNGLNWFNNTEPFPSSDWLEELFPKYWVKWRNSKNEIIAIIERYVHSSAMRKAGLPNDALAKSYAGLAILTGLEHGKTITRNTDENVHSLLDEYQIPHRYIDKLPISYELSKKLSVGNMKGSYLLNKVRNYVEHPLQKGDDPQIAAQFLRHLDANAVQYAYLHDLSQFYLEYTFLGFLGFQPNDYRPLLEIMNTPNGTDR